jgi:NAD(P)-dependent dehydrogenase (short-subunit alcohol dehydrogenase family)
MRRAVITGAASPDGIGWATALALADDGYAVIVTGVSGEELKRTPSHPSVTAVVLDVGEEAAVQALFAGLDRLDALVNCAGRADPRDEFTPTGFARTLDVNLTGTMRCCLAARPLLAEAKGAIVNVASMYAIFGSPVAPGYAASKGGVVQLTKSLAIAYAPNIRVNAVAPGWIKTGMARPVWEDPAWAQAISARTPMARIGEPAELADPIRFLCSPAARFITGVMLPVDGGYSCSG